MFVGIQKKRDYHYHKVLLLPIPISGLWQPVTAYCMGPLHVTTLGNRYIVVIGDLFTKLFESVAFSSIEANIIVQVFLDNLIF